MNGAATDASTFSADDPRPDDEHDFRRQLLQARDRIRTVDRGDLDQFGSARPLRLQSRRRDDLRDPRRGRTAEIPGDHDEGQLSGHVHEPEPLDPAAHQGQSRNMLLDDDLEVGKPGGKAVRGDAAERIVHDQQDHSANRQHSNLRASMPFAHDRDQPSIVLTKIIRKIKEIRALPDPNQYRFMGKKFTPL
jgi:hypothetical protein